MQLANKSTVISGKVGRTHRNEKLHTVNSYLMGRSKHVPNHKLKIYLTKFPVKTPTSPFLPLLPPSIPPRQRMCVVIQPSFGSKLYHLRYYYRVQGQGAHTHLHIHTVFSLLLTHIHSASLTFKCFYTCIFLNREEEDRKRERGTEKNGTEPQQTSGCLVNQAYIILKRPGTNTHTSVHRQSTIKNRNDTPDNRGRVCTQHTGPIRPHSYNTHPHAKSKNNFSL